MLLSGYSANALAGQARMASTRAGDRNRATSLMTFPLARRTFCGRSSRAAPGIEPGTYRALSENHTTKPSSALAHCRWPARTPHPLDMLGGQQIYTYIYIYIYTHIYMYMYVNGVCIYMFML